MTPEKVTYIDTWSAPRWANVESFVRDQCWALGLTVEIEVDKGWILERGRYRVTGAQAMIDEFRRRGRLAAEQYARQ